MLDLIGYNGNVYGKKVIENSCGEGNILCAIVSRYIEGLYGQTSEYIRNGLERDIVGYDVDAVCCEKTITKLNNNKKQIIITNKDLILLSFLNIQHYLYNFFILIL
jgi:hypothetical protein